MVDWYATRLELSRSLLQVDSLEVLQMELQLDAKDGAAAWVDKAVVVLEIGENLPDEFEGNDTMQYESAMSGWNESWSNDGWNSVSLMNQEGIRDDKRFGWRRVASLEEHVAKEEQSGNRSKDNREEGGDRDKKACGGCVAGGREDEDNVGEFGGEFGGNDSVWLGRKWLGLGCWGPNVMDQAMPVSIGGVPIGKGVGFRVSCFVLMLSSVPDPNCTLFKPKSSFSIDFLRLSKIFIWNFKDSKSVDLSQLWAENIRLIVWIQVSSSQPPFKSWSNGLNPKR